MIDVVLKRALEEYASNFRVMLSFGVLFIFLPVFLFFSQFFFSSGTVFLSINADILAIIGIVVALIFLYIFSFFVSLTVYSVHRDLQTVNFDTYWDTLFKDAALKIFSLYLILAIVLYAIAYVGFITGASSWAMLIDLVISLAVMYAPQSIVLNQAGLGEAVERSLEFWAENPVISFVIFLLSVVILLVFFGVEIVLDSIALPGKIVSFFLVLIFLVPFIEQAKSYAYMLRVDLLRSNEVTHARAPKKERPKLIYSTRMREQPRHGTKL